jgi:hypothetical protein
VGIVIASWIIIAVIIISLPSLAEERMTEMCKGGRGRGGDCLGVNTAQLPCCGRAGKASERMFSWSSSLTTSLKTTENLFCDVIFSLMRKICYTQYINNKKNMGGKVTGWWSGNECVVVDGSVPMQNFYSLSCRMYELI